MKIKIYPKDWTVIERRDVVVAPPDLAFLVIPYETQKPSDVFENILNAREFAKKIWAKGIAVICPQLNALFLDSTIDKDILQLGHQQMLRACDLVVISDDWYTQDWCKAAVTLARQLQLPITDTNLSSVSDIELGRNIQ